MEIFSEALNSYPAWSWAAALITIFAATVVQFSLGIAFGIVAGPLLALNQIDFVPAPVLLLTCMTATTGAIREWKLVHWDEVRWSVSGRLIGGLVAIFVLTLIPDEKTFMLVFGALIAVAVLLSVSGLNFPFNLRAVGMAGTASGFTATITGVGGPPMAVVYQHRKPLEARPTLQVYFAMGSMLSFLLLLATDHVAFRSVVITLFLVPGFLAGYFASPYLRDFFDRNFRVYLLGMAGIASLLLIWRGLS